VQTLTDRPPCRLRGGRAIAVLIYLAALMVGYIAAGLTASVLWFAGLALAAALDSTLVANVTYLVSALLEGAVPGAVSALLWSRRPLIVAPTLLGALWCWFEALGLALLRVDPLSWVALALLIAGLLIAFWLVRERRAPLLPSGQA